MTTMTTPGIFAARFASSCLCGQWVGKGDPIAFCSVMRRVTMCPACRPVKSCLTYGDRIAVVAAGLDLTVASVRTDSGFYALDIKPAGVDYSYAYATFRVVGGEWVCVDSFGGIDAPKGLTSEDVNSIVAQARAAFRKAA